MVIGHEITVEIRVKRQILFEGMKEKHRYEIDYEETTWYTRVYEAKGDDMIRMDLWKIKVA